VADDSLAALCLVAVPDRALAPGSAALSYPGPVLMIAGENDHVSSVEALTAAATGMQDSVSVVRVPDVDHFWWGHEETLFGHARAFFAPIFAAGPAGSARA
jgi:alpha/beta superfamily hydrolase